MNHSNHPLDKIKITHNNGIELVLDSCPLVGTMEIEIPTSADDSLSGGLKGPYCGHPTLKGSHLICSYSLTEITVPSQCPLRRENLTTKVEVLINYKISG